MCKKQHEKFLQLFDSFVDIKKPKREVNDEEDILIHRLFFEDHGVKRESVISPPDSPFYNSQSLPSGGSTKGFPHNFYPSSINRPPPLSSPFPPNTSTVKNNTNFSLFSDNHSQ